LVRGQRAQHLSAHYQLECDYGTTFLAIYNEGDAVYLCENHSSAVRRSDEGAIAGVRVIKSPPADAKHAKIDVPIQASDAAAASPDASALPVPACTPADSELPATVDEPIEIPQPTAAEAAEISDQSVLDVKLIDADERPAPLEIIEDSEPAAAEPGASSPPEQAASPAADGPRREPVRPSAKGLVRDLTFGDSARALVDEAIWNMAPGDCETYRAALQQGKSAAEAAQAAGGQLAIVHRRISECTAKIESLLSHSHASIEVSEVIEKPLEQAILEIIGNGTLSDTEKDAAIGHLGTFQAEINRGLGRVISPHQAHRIARAVGDRANWGARSILPEEVKPAYRAVFTSVRNAVLSAVPEAHILHERLANLYAAKCDIAGEPALKASQSAAR
jgi:hypothetical protein